MASDIDPRTAVRAGSPESPGPAGSSSWHPRKCSARRFRSRRHRRRGSTRGGHRANWSKAWTSKRRPRQPAGRRPSDRATRATHLVEVLDPGAVKDRQMGEQTGPQVQLVEHRGPGCPQVCLGSVTDPELTGAAPQAVAEWRLLEPAQLHQLLQDPVHGGSRCTVERGRLVDRATSTRVNGVDRSSNASRMRVICSIIDGGSWLLPANVSSRLNRDRHETSHDRD